MMFSVRVTRYQHLPMLHICDADLLGRNLSEDGLQISITRSCYGRKLVDAAEARTLLMESAVINMAGKETIRLSADIGMGQASGARIIDGVPFLVVFRM